ncbi:MAG: UDP-glucose/GDP-mannose dehydrogenase family protein [Deltaproteobacteria bacterium]|nr:UDP-glucose/GDP-mannose dehydrogenase family protein [Deltaproteobacteria bacterium]
MNIAVIGTGYVGLVAGTCFAESGNDVICVDVDEQKIDILKTGVPTIYEPGLRDLLERNIEEGRLRFTTDLDSAVRASLVIFIAVGTPEGEDGSADLTHVLGVARNIARCTDDYKVIVTKSTVPVGTGDRVRQEIAAVSDTEVDVVSNPEFLKEGAAVDDFMKPDRVVIGTESDRAREIMVELYSPFVRTGNPIITMGLRSAEMTKYAANALLATKISFMNEIANLCELLGVDVNEVRVGIGSDHRIGTQFLFPGVGFGGSCFPKDLRALLKMGHEAGRPLQVVEASERVNNAQKEILYEKIRDYFGGKLSGLKIAVWGLAFKPRTDDMREASSVTIIDKLLDDGARVVAYDPEAMERARSRFGDRIQYAANAYVALEKADALAVVTEWNEFRRPNFAKMRELLSRPIIFDGRNIYTPAEIRKHGFTYVSIGAPIVEG